MTYRSYLLRYLESSCPVHSMSLSTNYCLVRTSCADVQVTKYDHMQYLTDQATAPISD